MKKQLLLLSFASLLTVSSVLPANNKRNTPVQVGQPTPFRQSFGIACGAGVGTFGAYKSMMLGAPLLVKMGVGTVALGTGAILMAQADSRFGKKPVLFTNGRFPESADIGRDERSKQTRLSAHTQPTDALDGIRHSFTSKQSWLNRWENAQQTAQDMQTKAFWQSKLNATQAKATHAFTNAISAAKTYCVTKQQNMTAQAKSWVSGFYKKN